MSGSDPLVAAHWRREVLRWFDTWQDEPQLMPSGRRRSAGRLLRACLGLVEFARADGKLKGTHADYWSIKQLAPMMATSERTAPDILAWLEQSGRMSKARGAWTEYGRGTDIRCLVCVETQTVTLNSTVAVTQTATIGGANGNATLEPNGNATLSANGNVEIDPYRTRSFRSLPKHSLAVNVGKPTQTNGTADSKVLVASKQRTEYSPRVVKVSEAELRRRALVPRVEGEPCEPWELPGAEA
jgi:hypothetical protein